MRLLVFALAISVFLSGLAAQDQAMFHVGFAKVDITPTYPVRLNGFGNRRQESEGVSQSLFARAMAISQGQSPPLVVVAIDNLGVRLTQVDQVARRLNRSHQLPRENLVVTFTHTHCGPKVRGASDNIFSEPIPDEHQKHIDQYTTDLVDAITDSARRAIDSRAPSTLGWSIGEVGFAINRRTPAGPVDHDLPTLVVRAADSGKIRGVYVSYACHCVTLRFNQISGDWAGYAAEMIERQFPDAVALVSIGAGSDQNPSEVTPDDIQIARRQGSEIADEVKRLSERPQQSVTGATQATLRRIDLPLRDLPSREQLARLSSAGGRPADRYNAATQIAKLDRGEPLIAAIDYPIQTWTFGNSLCISFLAGEVCVDYALRLKKEIDAERFWLIAYSNDFCSYIPSERLVQEGGYGGGGEVPYFALPATLAPGLEQRIVDEVHRQVPLTPAVPAGVQGVPPKSPLESLDCMRTHDHLQLSLAAAEPLVIDPVAIDFGVDGCLWVAEMRNYGRGVYEEFPQSGRIRCLGDQDGDGYFDRATTFVDGLRFPTDVKVWRDGVLICDAPQILYARDTDSDGVADQIETLFSGFEVRNAQARVNSLRWGLDNWIYGACGLFGGQIKSHRSGKTTSVVGRDFRMNPDTGEIQAVSGRTQQGRCRNDWGDWFGCSNGNLLSYFGDDDRYADRNRFVAAASPRGLTGGTEVRRLYPPQNLVRFELSGTPGAATSACGLDLFRDLSLGEDYFHSAFTCEPVHQLVHRIHLRPDELTYNATRGEGEAEFEFLTSTDQWFRPVQARTGPDGALWVVDMYRYVIEHPRWIPQSTLAELDVFAGHQLGRIYRVTRSESPTRKSALPNLSTMSNLQLSAVLGSTNGTLRDLAHQLLVWREAEDVADSLRKTVTDGGLPQAKIHALAILAALDQLERDTILSALQDNHPEVVRHGLRWSEPWLATSNQVRESVIALASHASPRVRTQVAWSLGATDHPEAVAVLAALSSKAEPIAGVRFAVLHSLDARNSAAVLQQYVDLPKSQQWRGIEQQMVTSAIRMGPLDQIEPVIALVTDEPQSDSLLAAALDAADARIGDQSTEFSSELRIRVDQIHQGALAELSLDSLRLLGRQRGPATRLLLSADPQAPTSIENVSNTLARLLTAKESVEVQVAAVETLANLGHANAAELFLDRFATVSESARAAILDALPSRAEWAAKLLDRIETGDWSAGVLGADRRSKLLDHRDPAIQRRSTQVLGMQGSPDRKRVVQKYAAAMGPNGNVDRGREHFRKHCSGCHQLDGLGHIVGPDLLGLTNRDPLWLLTAILDPNRDVDGRYVTWSALSEDGRVVSGIVVDETETVIRLRESGGKEHQLLRAEVEELRTNNQSLMPVGLEQELSEQQVSDLLAYISQAIVTTVQPADAASLPRYPPQIAPFLLDESQSVELRQRAIDQRPGMGPAIIALLTETLSADDIDTQYQRIPWIWRVALAVGQRNDGGEIRDLLEQSLPEVDRPLAHWQAVVIGGGVINGLTQVGRWPRQRIAEILNGSPALVPRWQHALDRAALMANDPQVRTGTRYDALRMIALSDPSIAVSQLKNYLAEGTDPEIRMGAVSGLADIDSPEITSLLIQSLNTLKDRNRQLAVEGLLRSTARSNALLQSLAKQRNLVQAAELKALLDHRNPTIAENASLLISRLAEN